MLDSNIYNIIEKLYKDNICNIKSIYLTGSLVLPFVENKGDVDIQIICETNKARDKIIKYVENSYKEYVNDHIIKIDDTWLDFKILSLEDLDKFNKELFAPIVYEFHYMKDYKLFGEDFDFDYLFDINNISDVYIYGIKKVYEWLVDAVTNDKQIWKSWYHTAVLAILMVKKSYELSKWDITFINKIKDRTVTKANLDTYYKNYISKL